MSTALNAAGGGKVVFQPGKTYWVGAQTNVLASGYQFPPVTQYLIYIHNCTKPVLIDFNGSTIKTIAGLKYGNFNADGTVNNPAMPYYGNGIAVPFYSVLRIEGCSGGVIAKNSEFDGNINNLVIGGQWGDVGRQIPHSGIETVSNTCSVIIDNIYTHHFGLDGVSSSWPGIVAGTVATSFYPVILRDCRSLYNGRQGWSFVGGVGGWAFNCDFSHTGKSGAFTYSPPGAGVDMESESSIIRNMRFIDCRAENNSGVAYLQVGDTADIEFYRGKAVGTTSWTFYGAGPYTRCYDMQITGAGNNQYGSTTDPKSAMQFHDCKFLFGTARSPTGAVYDGGVTYMWNGGGTSDANVLFDNCVFDNEGTGVSLPWFAGAGPIWRDCHFKLTGAAPVSHVAGKFYGTNSFDIGANGNDTAGSTIYGRLLLNGTPWAGLFAKNEHSMNFATAPGINSIAQLTVGPLADPGIGTGATNPADISINSWLPVGNGSGASLTFKKNGVQSGQIYAYDFGGAMIFYPPNTGGSGEFWFQDPTNSFTNLRVYTSGIVSARSAFAINGTGVIDANRAATFTSATLSGAGAPLTVNSTNSNGGKLLFQDNGVLRSYIGSNSSGGQEFIIFNADGNAALNIYSVANLRRFEIIGGAWGSTATTRLGVTTGWQAFYDTVNGGVFSGGGSSYDVSIQNKNGTTVWRNPTGTTDAEIVGNLKVIGGNIRRADGNNIISSVSGTATILYSTGLGTYQFLDTANTNILTLSISASTGAGSFDKAISSVSNITSSGGSLGYTTGAGGAVTQLTSKTTAVTLNKVCGQFTTNNAALASAALATFQVNNSLIAATDVIIPNLQSGQATVGTYRYWVEKVAAGSFQITIENRSAGSLSEALVFNFVAFKAVNA